MPINSSSDEVVENRIDRPAGSVGDRLEFEMLLSELSTTFINVPHDQIDSEIEHALERLVKLLGFERASLYQAVEGGIRITHSWAVDGSEPMQQLFLTENEVPWYFDAIKNKQKIVVMNSLDDLPPEAARDKEFMKKHGIRSSINLPLVAGGEYIGTVGFGSLSTERTFPQSLVQRIRLIGAIFSNALQRKKSEQALHQAYSEIKTLKDQLQIECGYLREEIELNFAHSEIIGQSNSLKQILKLVEQVAATDASVLIQGETGTGKELLARAVHNLSPRKSRAMVKVNCAALPATLVENELFGRERGAYTGASTKQVGRFEVANGTTIFLDEISELPLELQSKLLRVIQEGQFERIGSHKTISVDVRIIAATNRNLAQSVRDGEFRNDLFYRLNVFPIEVAPLRERREDIPLLVWHFVKKFEQTLGKTVERIPEAGMESLRNYDWPGNIRELRNVVERSMILNNDRILQFDLSLMTNQGISSMTLQELEKKHILETLQKTGWRVRGKHGAAELLGLKPTTLDARIKKLGIPRRMETSNIL